MIKYAMADIFLKRDLQNLLQNRLVWILGGSNIRAIYKDLIWLLQKNQLISQKALKSKLEPHFMGDDLINGDTIHSGRSYVEDRQYRSENLRVVIDFKFLTRCLTSSLISKLEGIKNPEDSPDLIIINSCLWDICRWGPDGVNQYKQNVIDLMKLFKKHLDPSTLVIWVTTPPVASTMRGGLIIKQIEFMNQSVRFEVMEGNLFVRQEVISHGFDVLDLHYHLLLNLQRRSADGIHWEPEAVRHITNLILTHVAISWGVALPGNFTSVWTREMLAGVSLEPSVKPEATIKKLDAILGAKPAPKPAPKAAPKKKKNKGARKPYQNQGILPQIPMQPCFNNQGIPPQVPMQTCFNNNNFMAGNFNFYDDQNIDPSACFASGFAYARMAQEWQYNRCQQNYLNRYNPY